MPKLLTKSKYLQGLQCSKLLWVSVNDKMRIPEPSVSTEAIFKAGNLIGVLATKVFKNGIDLSGLDFKENIKQTEDALKKRKPIFEAGFLEGRLFSRADILLPVVGGKWDIIEVKSSTEIKDINIHDLSFQRYTYEKAGLKIRKCILMHVNSAYVKSGNIAPEDFFVQADVTEMADEFGQGIKERINEMLKIIDASEPKYRIGTYCGDPYVCPLKFECWANVPKESVFEFYWMLGEKKFGLWDNGVRMMKDVGDDANSNYKQEIQQRLARGKEKVHIDKEKIGDWLKELKYPIYYLDFETINPVLPKFDGMKPYQRIPFQFSLHIQSKNGNLKHYSFLAEGVEDPRMEFMMELRRLLNKKGSIVVYNQGFEKGVMTEGATAFPEFREWYDGNIKGRVVDLLDVFREFWYYDSGQKGSCSIKAVLPVLSDLKYSDLEIGKGDLASLEYERVTYGDVGEEERLKVRAALEKYCELDTLAEVEIVCTLRNIISC